MCFSPNSSRLNFYPRPPRGGRLHVMLSMLARSSFLSTPSARRATAIQRGGGLLLRISIHALREEGDSNTTRRRPPTSYFYPRPPRGGRPVAAGKAHPYHLFLSTPSARRATPSATASRPSASYFYPRPPRGGRPRPQRLRGHQRAISIHALREEGDSKNRDKISVFKQIIQHSARI